MSDQQSSNSHLESGLAILLELREERRKLQELRNKHHDKIIELEAKIRELDRKDRERENILQNKISFLDNFIGRNDDVYHYVKDVKELWCYFTTILGYEGSICEHCQLFILNFRISWRHISLNNFSLDYSSCYPANNISINGSILDAYPRLGKKAKPTQFNFYAINNAKTIYDLKDDQLDKIKVATSDYNGNHDNESIRSIIESNRQKFLLKRYGIKI